ncbi:MAG: hypothetical protein QOJ24_4596 [Mycobacterium sp.]|nr:hypothetical protein [Mycobacterium sp.]
MAHSTVRFAAGAGVVAASLLILGPNPAHAVADKHGPGSQFDNDSRKNVSSGKGGNVIGGFDIAGQDAKPDLDPPLMNLGTGGGDLQDVTVVNSFPAQDQTAMRSAAVAEAPAGDNITAAAPQSGGGYSGRPATSFQAPRVTIGNGRTPGTNVPHPTPGPEATLLRDTLVSPAAVPPMPAVPAAIEINIPPLPPPLPPVERIRAADLVPAQFGTSTTDTVTDPLAGLAGLILIPAIGAVLGYRQARAAQSLRDSLRT